MTTISVTISVDAPVSEQELLQYVQYVLAYESENDIKDDVVAIMEMQECEVVMTGWTVNRPKIVCLCGSTKFKTDFERANKEETLAGNIVLSVGMFGHEIGLDMAGAEKRAIDRLHFRKIELADEIIIIHPDYMGLSTCDEYHYALALGKPVRFQTKENEDESTEEYECRLIEEYGLPIFNRYLRDPKSVTMEPKDLFPFLYPDDDDK